MNEIIFSDSGNTIVGNLANKLYFKLPPTTSALAFQFFLFYLVTT